MAAYIFFFIWLLILYITVKGAVPYIDPGYSLIVLCLIFHGMVGTINTAFWWLNDGY